MSLTKRIKGNFTIETVDASASGDTITLNPANYDEGGPGEIIGEVVIDGDLTVKGTTTTIESVDTEIVDNTIILNSGEPGNGVTEGFSGIEIDRGGFTNAGIRFNETGTKWEVHNGTSWDNVVTGTGGLLAVVDDPAPQLGGNLDVNGFTITSAAAGDVVLDADTTGAVKVNHKLSLEHESTPASYNEIYADAISGGGTGLYTGTDEELVSLRKAKLYSLIF